MLDEQTMLTSVEWLPLRVCFQKDSMKVVMLLTMKTKFELHTLCGNLTYSYAMRIESLPSFHVVCLRRWSDAQMYRYSAAAIMAYALEVSSSYYTSTRLAVSDNSLD